MKTPTRSNSSLHLRFTIVLLLFAGFAFVPGAQAVGTVTKTSNGTGGGSWGTAGTWSPSGVPASTDVVEIKNGDSVTVGSTASIAGVLVDNGGTLTLNAALTINHGTSPDIDVHGTVNVTVQAGITSGTGSPTLTVETDGTIQHGITKNILSTSGFGTITINGTYQITVNLSSSSLTIPTATWGSVSTLLVTGDTSGTSTITGLPSSVGNLTWNCSGQTAAYPLLQSGGTLTINGNLTVTSTGSGALEMGKSAQIIWYIGGNYTVNSGATFAASDSDTVNYTNNIIFTGTGTINVAGTLWSSGKSATGEGISMYYIVSSGSVMTLGHSWTLAGQPSHTTADNVTVASGGTLNCSTYNIINNAATGIPNNTFTLASGGTLGIGSANGITSGTTGNIQVNGSRSFSTGGNYTYNGSGAQAAGNGLPATVNNFTITNSSGVTLSGNLTVAGAFAATAYNGSTIPLAAGSDTVTFESSLMTITVTGSELTSGNYTIVSSSGTTVGGTLGALTVNGNGAVQTPTISDSTGQLILNVPSTTAPSAYAITGGGSPTAGAADNLTVTALNSSGGTLTGFSQPQTLSFYGLNSSPNSTAPTVTDNSGTAQSVATTSPGTLNCTLTFVSGVAQVGSGKNGVLKAYDAQTATLNCSDGTTSSASGTGAAGLALTVAPASVHQLVMKTEPSGTVTAGAAFTQEPAVYLEDAYGNVESGNNSSVVTAIVQSGHGTGPLTSTTTATASSGTATFSGLNASTLAQSGLELGFTDSGDSLSQLNDTTSITVSPAAAAKLAIGVPIATPQKDSLNFAPSPTVIVEDQYDNPVNGDTSMVTANLLSHSGTGSLGGTQTANANGTGGTATFSALDYVLGASTTVETMQVQFTDSGEGLTAVNSGTVTVNPNLTMTFSTPPTSTTAGATINSGGGVVAYVTVGGSPVSDGTSVTISIASGSGTLNGTLTRTTSGGYATFSDLSINTAGAYTLQAVSGSSLVTSGSFNISAGTVSTSVSTVSPSSVYVLANGTSTATITVTLLDSYNNPISGKTVTLAQTSGSGATINTVQGTTDSSGHATFTVSSSTTGAAVFTATDTTDSSAQITAMATVNFYTSANFESTASGDWTSAGTWIVDFGSGYQSGTGFTPNNFSGTMGTIQIANNNTVTVSTSVTATNLTVNNGGEISISSGGTLSIGGASTPGLNVGNGTAGMATMDVNGAFTIQAGASIAVNTNGILINETGATISTNATGTLTFNGGGTYEHNLNGGVIPIASWNIMSTNLITGVTTTVPSGLGQTFGNVTWDCTGQTTTLSLGGALTTVDGNFTVTTGSGGILQLGTAGYTLTIGGDFNIQSGEVVGVATTSAVNAIINVDGNFIVGSSGTWSSETTGSSSANTILNLYGNVLLATGNHMTRSSGNAYFNFAKSGTQIYTNGNTSGIATSYKYNVENGSTLNMGPYVFGTASSPLFTNQPGGTLISAHTGGLNGNIGFTGSGVSLSTSGNYEFNIGGGWVTNITIVSGGTGYSTSNTTVTVTGGGGTGATATVSGTNSSGTITNITLVSDGSGYSSAPTVTISGSGTGASASAILDTTAVTGTFLPSAVNNLTIASVNSAVALSGTVTATNLTINSGATLDTSPSSYGITIAGNWTDNGTFTPETGTVTFVPGSSSTLTVAGSTTFTNVAVSTGAKLALAASQTTVNMSLSGTNKASGTWGATGSGAAFVDNNYFSGTAGTMNVTYGVLQTITFGSGSSIAKTYGSAAFGDTATASSGLAVSYSSDNSSVATVNSSGTVTIAGVGTTHILANQAGNINYNPATQTSQTLTVNPLAAVLSGTRPYDSTTNAPAAILAVANAVGSDNVTVASGVGGLAGVNAGTQNITYFDSLTLSGGQVANYTMTGATGSVIITKTNISVTSAANSKTYDGTTNAATAPTITAGGLQGSDTANFTESYASKNVGNNLTLTPAGTVNDGNTGNNYSYTFVPENVGTILQAGTAITVVSSENPSGYKDMVIFTASSLPSDATGSVQFLTNGVLFDIEPLNNGLTTTTNSGAVNPLPRGTDTITAQYAGDGNYIGSTNSLVQTMTNHPPMALTMTAYRTPGMNLRIPLSDIATNWSDADGDTVELMGVNQTTTNDQTLWLLNVSSNEDNSFVINSNSFVGYTNGPSVADQFSYSIADGYGGTNIGYVYIMIVSSVTGTNSITMITGGNPTVLTAYGLPGYTYTVQRATNLTSPVWVNIQSIVAATNGVISATDNFSDLSGNQPQSAYYRLSWQP
jgi:hypothetical protein